VYEGLGSLLYSGQQQVALLTESLCKPMSKTKGTIRGIPANRVSCMGLVEKGSDFLLPVLLGVHLKGGGEGMDAGGDLYVKVV